MKKFFFFRSSNGNSNQISPPSTDKQVHQENQSESYKYRSKKQCENQAFGTTPTLRRSLSFSAGAVYGDQIGSPCSSTGASTKHAGRHSPHTRALTPERHPRAKSYEVAAVANGHRRRVENPGCVSSFRDQNDSSESSSYCSSKVVDRYVDGEQQQEMAGSMRNYVDKGNNGGKLPPRTQNAAPALPNDGRKQKPKSHSFRETKGTQLNFSSKDWMENGFGHESPRKIAKHVVERLTQSRFLPRTESQDFDSDTPITIEDVYGGNFSRCPSEYSDGASQKDCMADGQNVCGSDYSQGELPVIPEKLFSRGTCGIIDSVEVEEDRDMELYRKFKAAEERAMFLSEELQQENFLHGRGLNLSVSALVQTIRTLMKERLDMAFEVSSTLQDHISERASAKDELRLAKADIESRTRRLEKERNEMQSALEKELDRRSAEWSLKLEKYQAEEQRLRDRVRELAEQNVSLQRELSLSCDKEVDSRSRISNSEQQLTDLSSKLKETREENQGLKQNMSELQEKYISLEGDRDSLLRDYEEKVKECKDLHRSISRLQRTCSEQERTIDGLRVLYEEFGKKKSPEDIDNQLGKLQIEQMRLTGVEHALRKEVESYRLEVDSLRHENIKLLHRLKDDGKDGGISASKLDQELWDRFCALQQQGQSLVTDSTQLSMKLLEFIKSHSSEVGQAARDAGLDGQFLVECDVKLQGLRRGIESLKRNLKTVSAVLEEKSHPLPAESQVPSSPDDPQQNAQNLQEELKAETLLTRLLREKIYSKEVDTEQLQAELAAAIRGNDILKCEVQNAMDTISRLTHQIKEFEVQMIKKDETINHLQNDLQDCTKDLKIIRGILPKVSEERDMMWTEVKQFSEKNMLLNAELNVLKKRIETLDEDILLKDGQITILKDTLGKPFDLLASPDSSKEFLLE